MNANPSDLLNGMTLVTSTSGELVAYLATQALDNACERLAQMSVPPVRESKSCTYSESGSETSYRPPANLFNDIGCDI